LAKRAEAAEAGEEFVGGCNVAGDLGAKFFGAGEFFFVTETFPEAHFDMFGSVGERPNGRVGGRRAGCRVKTRRYIETLGPIQDVRFDAEGGAIERGTHANVGDRAAAEALAFQASARDVNTAEGKQTLFRSEI